MGFLPTSPEWTRQRTPDALPYGVQHRCFDYCVPTPDFQLRYMPSPCVCTEEGPRPYDGFAPRITSAVNVGATIGTPFTYQIIATNSPTSFAARNLPAGLTLNTTTGEITGTPTGPAGVQAVILSATNDDGTGTNTLRINVTGAAALGDPGHAGTLSMSSAGGSYVITEADVLALPQVPSPSRGSVITVPQETGSFGFVFAYPATLPAATQIMDLTLGMNMMAGFTASTMTLTLPSGPVDYRVYALHNNGPFPSAGPGYALTIGTS